MKLTREDVEAWRRQLDVLASDSSTRKQFRLSPDGRFVIMVDGEVVHDGRDVDLALMKYNAI